MHACTHAPSKNVARAIDNNYAHALTILCTFVNCWHPALHDLHGDNYSVKMLTHAGEMAQLPQYSRLPRLLMVEPDQDGLIAPSTISKKYISQRISGSYPVQKAVELMETADGNCWETGIWKDGAIRDSHISKHIHAVVNAMHKCLSFTLWPMLKVRV